MRFIIFTVILFATSQSFAQSVQLLRGFNTAARAVGSGTSVTESMAARFLISQASAARIAGVSSAALRSVDELETALNRILQSNNTDLKNKTNNFLRAVQAATSQIEGGKPVTDVLRTSLTISALSTEAQKASAQVRAAEGTAADSVAATRRDRIVRIDAFKRETAKRFAGNPEAIAKLDEAVSEIKATGNKNIEVLGTGAANCMSTWPAANDAELLSLVNILSHTDNPSTQKEARDNLANGMKAELGVSSDAEVAARLTALSSPANCQALHPAVAP